MIIVKQRISFPGEVVKHSIGDTWGNASRILYHEEVRGYTIL